MASTHVLLEKITVGAAGAASVTFNSIPQTGYTDLKLVVSSRTTGTSTYWDDLLVKPNGVTTNASIKSIYFVPGTLSSGSVTTGLYMGNSTNANALANTFSSLELTIPNYASSNYKSMSADGVTENDSGNADLTFVSGVWSSTAAITSLTLSSYVGNFVQYSTFALYGVSNSVTTPVYAPMASGGDIIQSDGTYWYHAFLNGTQYFTPTKALGCDILVVAGGGGGGNAGGGGAGGVLAFSGQTCYSGTSYAVTVGAGGNGGAYYNVGQTNGGNSQFGSLTAAVGGGKGGDYSLFGGGNGGSGGGGGGAATGTPSTAVGGTGTSGQGNAGGNGLVSNATAIGGGGGGAGSAGGNYSGTTGGAGGSGVNTVTNWGSLSTALTTLGLGASGYIAGGGGGGADAATGGAAGSGGAGAGKGNATTGNDATPNTGSGGGGTWSNSGTLYAGKGGSGVVIVRYAI